MTAKIHCPLCGKTVLERVIPETGGICMPCHKKALRKEEAVERERCEALKRELAIKIHVTDAELRFLIQCSVYCIIDCCGFDAIDISHSTFAAATKSCGLDIAKDALMAMRGHIRLISDSSELVNVFGHFEAAEDTKLQFALCVAVLLDVIEEEQGVL